MNTDNDAPSAPIRARTWWTVAVILLLAACAQTRELTGGEKDTEAPILQSADPPDGTVRFAADRIVLRFNERVKLDRVRDRLLISPPLDKPPDVNVRAGQEVIIALRAPLKANTTYTFNIGEAVTDITENNPAAGLTYVVSSGDALDSAHIAGSVIDAFTDKPGEGLLVTLHADTDSTGFIGGRPAYFTRTDKQGAFILRHLREGRYHLHVLEDKNANLRRDLPNERLAFADGPVTAPDSSARTLRMFLPLAEAQQVKEAAVQPDRAWRLVLARPADSLSLRSIDRSGGSLAWLQEWNHTRDTVLMWPKDTTLLNGQRFAVTDSTGALDTLTYRPVRKMPFNPDARAAGRAEDGAPLIIVSRPVGRIDSARLILRIDSVVAPVRLAPADGLRRLRVEGAPADRASVLTLLPGALHDIYGGASDTLRIALGPGRPADTGDLKLNLTADSGAVLPGPFFYQLLNAQGGVMRNGAFATLPYRAELPATPAGTYTLKLVQDTDGDGRWSTGSLAEKRQPERTFRLAGDVIVRAGWEVVVDWAVEPPLP